VVFIQLYEKTGFLQMGEVFCNMTQCHWTSSSKDFEGIMIF